MQRQDTSLNSTYGRLFTMLLIAMSFAFPNAAIRAQQPEAITSPKGITPAEVVSGSAKLVEPMAASQHLRLAIALRPPNLAAEEKFLEELQTKGSPNFGKFLSQQEWNKRFSPSEADEQAVVDWAQANGFTVSGRYPNRLVVDVEAPVATIEAALGVKVNNYMVAGNARFSSDRDPQVPTHLIGVIQNIQGLNNINMLHPLSGNATPKSYPVYAAGPVVGTASKASSPAKGPKPRSLTDPDAIEPRVTGGAYDPTDIYSSQGYDVQALYNQGHCCNPTGNSGGSPKETTIAIVTSGAQAWSDIAGFQATYPYLAYHMVQVPIDGQVVPCNPSTTSCDGEGTMDAEWATAMSNSFGSLYDTSTVIMYDGVNPQFSTFTDMYNRVLSDNSSRIMTTSWGCAEVSCYDATDMNTVHAIFNNMVGTGWTLVAASGDQGATAGCGNAYRVQYPSSDPNVVGAGGTTMQLNSSGSFVSQAAWSGGPAGCSHNDGGSTGGVSAYWAKPSYQSTFGYSGRAVPDLALNADWYYTPQNLYFGGGLSGNGGTSIVAPELAGIFAQFNAYLLTLGNNCANEGGPCAPMGGLVNSMVYYLGLHPTYAAHNPFYDITTGCNNNDITAYYGLSSWCAGTGYDPVTGWGSFNALQLAWGINTYRAGDFGAPVVSFSGPATSTWFNTDQTVAWSIADTSGINGYAANGISGYSKRWDTDPGDVTSEPTPGSGNSFYSGPENPRGTSGSLNVSSAGQGCHTANIRAWDNSGFGSGDRQYGPVCYDTVIPTVASSTVPVANSYGWQKGSVSVIFSPSDAGGSAASGILKTYYAIDSTSCKPSSLGSCLVYNGPITVTAQGNHSIPHFTEDKAGNFSIEPNRRVSIDTTDPVSSAALSGTLKGSVYTTAVKVSVNSTDNLSGVLAKKYSLDGGATTNYTASFTVSAPGSHTVKYYGVDKALNYEAAKSKTFTIASPTSTILTVSPNPAVVGSTVTLKAVVDPSLSGTPTGTVTFKRGTTTIGTATLSGGAATITTTTLPAGTSSLTVSYAGSSKYLASTSPAVSEVVKQKTKTTLTSSLNPSTFGKSVTFTAKVTPSSTGTPSGTIKFMGGSYLYATVTLSGGKATYTTSTLSKKDHTLNAIYSGSNGYAGSTSPDLVQTVK